MIINALNWGKSDTYIHRTTTEKESHMLINILLKRLNLKTKFWVKVRGIHKIEKKKKNSIGISDSGYGNKEKSQVYVSKNVVKENMLIYF